MKIDKVVKYDDNSYFYPMTYYFVAYDNNDYTIFEGDNLEYIDGVYNLNARDQIHNKEDILSVDDCPIKYTKVFYSALSQYKNNTKRIAEKVNEKLRIDHSYTNIYWYEPGDPNYKKIMKDYDRVLNVFKRKCFFSKINYEKNVDNIIKNIVNKIDEKIDPHIPDMRNDVSFCYSINAIENEYDKGVAKVKDLEDIDELKHKFEKAKQDLVMYTSEFFGLQDLATIALKSKKNDDNELIKKYTEFLLVLPKYAEIIAYVNSCISSLSKMKQEFKMNRYEKNPEFIEKIDKIIEHDTNEDVYLYHITQSEFDAQRIMNEGLYMYSDSLESTTYPELTTNELLEHGYGNEFAMYESYIMVIDKPKDVDIVRKLSEEEQENAQVMSRRIGIAQNPSYIIDSDYIIGYIDKNNMDVVINSRYKKNAR